MRIFVGSSSEAERYATGIKAVLEEKRDNQFIVTHWRDVAELSQPFITALATEVSHFEFAFFVLSPDDVRWMRNDEDQVPRDNVIFELGLFVGRLGQDRVFILVPDTFKAKLPSDLLGVTVGVYQQDDDVSNSSAVRVAVSEAVEKINRIAREARPVAAPSFATTDVSQERYPMNDSSHPGADGWRRAAKAGALVGATGGQMRIGDWLVHADWGLGQVVEIGPERIGWLYVVICFTDGSTATLRAEGLFEARFTGGGSR